MFPMAEIPDVVNTDFSILDDLCVLEDNQLSELETITNYNSMEGTSFGDAHALSADWLSGNVNLDFDTIEQSSDEQQSIINHAFHSSNSMDVSHSISSDFAGDFQSLIQESLVNEQPVFEERIYSSCDESAKSQTECHVEPHRAPDIEKNNERASSAEKKYMQMRKKNNIASQRSRKLRKERNKEMVERLKELEIENKELTLQAAHLEKQRDVLQRLLLQIISKK